MLTLITIDLQSLSRYFKEIRRRFEDFKSEDLGENNLEILYQYTAKISKR